MEILDMWTLKQTNNNRKYHFREIHDNFNFINVWNT